MSREYPCVYYDNQKCTLHSEPGYIEWCVLGPCSHKTPSNADHIRSMTDEELAEWLCGISDCNLESCPGAHLCAGGGGRANGIVKWLKQPYKEDT